MKNSSSAWTRFFPLIAIACSLVSISLRSVSLLLFYDTDADYYVLGSLLPMFSAAFLGISLIFYVTVAILCLKNVTVEYPRKNSLMFIGSAAPVIIATGILTFDKTANDMAGVLPNSEIIVILLSVMTIIYFICAVIKEIPPVIKVITGILTLIRIVAMLADSYFDQKVGMNTPDKLLFGIACITALIFIVGEMRVFAEAPRPRVFIFSSAAAMTICGTASLPSIIAYHANVFPETNEMISEYYFMLALSIYAGVRLFSVGTRSLSARNESSSAANRETETAANIAEGSEGVDKQQ